MKWPIVLLADVASLITKGTTPTSIGFVFEPSGIPFLRAQNLQNGRVYLSSDAMFISVGTHQALQRSIIKGGDVLLSIAGTIGRAALVENDAPPMNCNQAVAIIRSNAQLDPSYLTHWLSCSDACDQIKGRQVTATIANLSLAQIGTLRLALPPIEEQRRIAAILDQAEALRAKRRQALAKLDTLTQSLFLEMFGDPIRDTNRVSLSSIAEIVSGLTKGRPLRGQAVIMTPYLRVANVQAGFLDIEEMKYIEATAAEVTRLRLKAGDVLMTEGGDADKLGRGAIWNEEVSPCIHQNHVFRVRLDLALLLPVVFHWYLQMRSVKEYFLRCAKKTSNLASINMTQLKALPVFTPKMEVQQKFMSIAKSLDALNKAKATNMQALDILFHSLQHRAFRGEL